LNRFSPKGGGTGGILPPLLNQKINAVRRDVIKIIMISSAVITLKEEFGGDFSLIFELTLLSVPGEEIFAFLL